MPMHNSGAPAPIVPEPHKPASPRLVPAPAEPRPGRKRVAWLLASVVVVGGLLAFFLTRQAPTMGFGGGGPVVIAVRTVVADKGPVEHTLRLTGTTEAEHYSMLVAPRMRGSRNDTGRGGPSGNFTRSGGGGVQGRSIGGASAVGGARGAGGGGRGGGGGGGGAPAGGGGGAPMGGGGGMQQAQAAAASGDPNAALGAAGAMSAALARGGFGLTLQTTVPAGSFVRKGDVVAEFDREEMIQRLDDYQASVAQSENAYQKMLADVAVDRAKSEQTVKNAQADLDKAQLDLKAVKVLSPIQAEQTKLNLDEAKANLDEVIHEVNYTDSGIAADLKVAELDLQQSKVEMDLAKANVDKMVIKAPLDGLVVMQNIVRGTEFDRIKAGDTIAPGQSFMQIVDPSSMIVNAAVNQADSERLKIGQRAYVRFDAFSGLVLPARIFAIGTVGTAGQYRPDWVKEVTVKLKLEKMDPRVIPDLSVAIDVVLNSAEADVVVPREAVFTDNSPEGKPTKSYVFVKVANGWERRDVELGLTSFTKVAIRADIKPGETIALQRPSPQAIVTRTSGI